MTFFFKYDGAIEDTLQSRRPQTAGSANQSARTVSTPIYDDEGSF